MSEIEAQLFMLGAIFGFLVTSILFFLAWLGLREDYKALETKVAQYKASVEAARELNSEIGNWNRQENFPVIVIEKAGVLAAALTAVEAQDET